jgi:anti-sigma factor RsiW
MNHQRIQNALSAYLDNELSASMQKQVEAHLQSCQECADMLTAFQQNSSRIRGLVHPAPPLKDMVMAKIHEELQNDVSAYLDNELAPDMQKRVEAHLHTCNECSDMLTAFQQNRERIKGLAHPAPLSIQNAVMAQIREQAAQASVEKSSGTLRFPDLERWLPDFGRWFLRPVTAGATGLLTLVLILGALYFYPTAPQYEETLDFYFGLHTEQLTDDPLYSSDSTIPPTPSPESDGDTEMFLDLYLENVGN